MRDSKTSDNGWTVIDYVDHFKSLFTPEQDSCVV
jgi:hypothetical protein